MSVCTENMVLKYFYKFVKTIFQERILPHAEQTCVCFQHVEMCVHGLALVGVLVAQTHVFNRFPGPSECLEISALHRIVAILLDGVEKLVNLTDLNAAHNQVADISVLANITTLLAKDNVNVENLRNKSKGAYAYTLVDLGTRVDQAVIEDVKNLANVIRVRVIEY